MGKKEKEVTEITLALELRDYQQSITSETTFETGEVDEEKALKKAKNKFETRYVKIVSCKPV